MSHRTTQSKAYLRSKDDHHSFFGSPKKLAKVVDKPISEDLSPPLPSSPNAFIPPPSRTSSFRRSTPSPLLSFTTSHRARSPGSKQVSPEVVTSILNGMYAHPVPRQEPHPVSPRAWETEQPSHRLNALLEASRMPTLEESRTGSDKPEMSSRTANSIKSSLRSHSGSNSIASTSQGSDSSGYATTRSGARGSGSKTPSTGSQESGSSGSTLRVMGRGGSGSRLRLVAPQPEDLGSRSKARDVPWVSRQVALDAKPAVPERPVFIPPTGRGGSGSHPKPHGTPFLTILNKGNSKLSKRKGKERAEPRNVHPIPSHISYKITNDSSSTVNSSIHFVGETGPPSSPFFPNDENDRPMRTVRSAEQISLSPAFSASSSTFSSAPPPSTPTTTIPGDVSDSFDVYDDEKPPMPIDHRQRSLNKLTRTLGDVPPDNIFNPRSDSLFRNEHPPIIPMDSTFSRKDRSTKAHRRSSLSITSLSSIFVRPSGRPRDSVATHHTMSSLTDDLHQLELEDELSDLNESSSFICHSPGSPIMFSPPSPEPVRDRSAERSNAQLSSQELESEEGGDSVPSLTLSRSLSYTPKSRRRSVRIHSHNHSASTSDIRFDSNGVPLSNWMIPPSIEEDEVAFSVTHNVPDKQQSWTGEWNSDIQDVIKSLRSLR